jgi:hypothetical protein
MPYADSELTVQQVCGVAATFAPRAQAPTGA